MRASAHNFEELTLDYAAAGCREESLAVAQTAIDHVVEGQTLLHYYKSWALIRLERLEEAHAAIAIAEKQQPDCCFPKALQTIIAHLSVIAFEKLTPKAQYYLGNGTISVGSC